MPSGSRSSIVRVARVWDEIYSDFRTNAHLHEPGGVPTLVLTGPFNATGVGDTPSRRAISAASRQAPPRRHRARALILSTMARRGIAVR